MVSVLNQTAGLLRARYRALARLSASLGSGGDSINSWNRFESCSFNTIVSSLNSRGWSCFSITCVSFLLVRQALAPGDCVRVQEV